MLDYLKRIAGKIRLTLTSGSLEVNQTSKASLLHQLSDFPLGFDCGDVKINRAATLLRMLFLADFKDLQQDLNALIALGQEYTANP